MWQPLAVRPTRKVKSRCWFPGSRLGWCLHAFLLVPLCAWLRLFPAVRGSILTGAHTTHTHTRWLSLSLSLLSLLILSLSLSPSFHLASTKPNPQIPNIHQQKWLNLLPFPFAPAYSTALGSLRGRAPVVQCQLHTQCLPHQPCDSIIYTYIHTYAHTYMNLLTYSSLSILHLQFPCYLYLSLSIHILSVLLSIARTCIHIYIYTHTYIQSVAPSRPLYFTSYQTNFLTIYPSISTLVPNKESPSLSVPKPPSLISYLDLLYTSNPSKQSNSARFKTLSFTCNVALPCLVLSCLPTFLSLLTAQSRFLTV